MFDPRELQAIIGMCKHEVTFIEQAAQMVAGLKIQGALAQVQSIAAKAEQMIEAEAKKTREEKKGEDSVESPAADTAG